MYLAFYTKLHTFLKAAGASDSMTDEDCMQWLSQTISSVIFYGTLFPMGLLRHRCSSFRVLFKHSSAKMHISGSFTLFAFLTQIWYCAVKLNSYCPRNQRKLPEWQGKHGRYIHVKSHLCAKIWGTVGVLAHERRRRRRGTLASVIVSICVRCHISVKNAKNIYVLIDPFYM